MHHNAGLADPGFKVENGEKKECLWTIVDLLQVELTRHVRAVQGPAGQM